jgi:hypothetical protein
MDLDMTMPDNMTSEEYSLHAAPVLKLLQIAYEVQLADMEDLEMRYENMRSLEQVGCSVNAGCTFAR